MMVLAGLPRVVLERELTLLAEAKSAVGQCTLALGDERSNRLIAEISGVYQEVKDYLNVGAA